MKRTLAAALLLATGLAAVAQAALEPGEIAVSPMLGAHIFEGDQHIDDAATFGLGVSYSLTPEWAFELAAQFTPTETDPGGLDLDALVPRLDALYHLAPGDKLVPYLSAGIGTLRLSPDKGGSETEFALNYGAGLKYFLSKELALRAEARHLIVPDAPDSNLLVLAGLSFSFGTRNALPKPEPVDSDMDGIFDAVDLCPYSPPGVTIDFAGCPLDEDQDGVADFLDRCPMTPMELLVGIDGCPLDGDLDGVLDAVDQCPDTDPGILVDERGCDLKFTLQIEFDVDKAAIRPEYHGILREAAEFLAHYPAPYVLVVGHTDAQGDAAYNKKLSLERAQAVRRYLIDQFGADGEKLVARGFGEAAPVADNESAEGRRQNRRVELVCCALIPPES